MLVLIILFTLIELIDGIFSFFFSICCRETETGDDDIIFEDFARLRLKGEADA